MKKIEKLNKIREKINSMVTGEVCVATRFNETHIDPNCDFNYLASDIYKDKFCISYGIANLLTIDIETIKEVYYEEVYSLVEGFSKGTEIIISIDDNEENDITISILE